MDAAPPSFLTVPERPAKPRSAGITHVLDKGYSLDPVRSVLKAYSGWIDVWKLGWGTAYIEPALAQKIRLLRDHQVKPCTGGTLLEIAWLQNRVAEFFDFATWAGFECVEVSRGATELPLTEKRELIQLARSLGFEVFAEVGSKDPLELVSAVDWIAELQGDLDAGATWIVAEGRESGTVGLYDEDGSVRESLLDELASSAAAGRIIYEAPLRSQQAHLLRRLGPGVNLGNVALEDVMGLETLRLGLRSDTIGLGIEIGEPVRAR
ncbi:phosphosulfolactate synthase [Kribbella orskensis]|uniref:Phosphosulfolactate synthase n=1 Tax=Kribbella orskensis TaxID=2512216 RepID=A0ABY2BU58_9ACTN|nr:MULTISPECIES: phosphosulfolactate synthase [Kribbella]TCN44711.1 phosphosulfolactate synthase [Kribbella sp. VKM Ac-2500]TCO31511.1 phosphosulfolactate synthase [Kribbella orskensis]